MPAGRCCAPAGTSAVLLVRGGRAFDFTDYMFPFAVVPSLPTIGLLIRPLPEVHISNQGLSCRFPAPTDWSNEGMEGESIADRLVAWCATWSPAVEAVGQFLRSAHWLLLTYAS